MAERGEVGGESGGAGGEAAPRLSPEGSGAVGPMPDAPAERVRAVVERVLAALGVGDAHVEIEETDEEIRAVVEGGDLGLVIRKHGATIDAIQHVAGRAAFRGSDPDRRVVVDAAGYRDRREAALRRTADRAVADALAFGRPVELEPMSAAERRSVHTYLKDRVDVETHSEGHEPDRRLVVTPLPNQGDAERKT